MADFPLRTGFDIVYHNHDQVPKNSILQESSILAVSVYQLIIVFLVHTILYKALFPLSILLSIFVSPSVGFKLILIPYDFRNNSPQRQRGYDKNLSFPYLSVLSPSAWWNENLLLYFKYKHTKGYACNIPAFLSEIRKERQKRMLYTLLHS